MSMTDPIADLLTRMRNAMMAGHESADVPHSKTKEAIVKLLRQEGFITGYEVEEGQPFSVLKISLKYDGERKPAIRKIARVSKPGCRVYAGKEEIPFVLGGLGVSILSTSQGIMTGKQARTQGIGGEVLCEIY